MKEQWKAIQDWEGLYEVSSLGRVRSLSRVIVRSNGIRQSIPEKLLACKSFGKHGYVQVNLSDRSQDKFRVVFVHVLVAEAFVKRPKGTDRVCHKDDDGSNNVKPNLYWGNASTNGKDAYRNGRQDHKVMPRGTEVYNAVPDAVVKRVLRLREKKMYLKDIAEKVGLAQCTVQQICAFDGRFKEFR